MYVCLCNGVSDKKFVRLCASFNRNLFSNYVSLFRGNQCGVFVPRVK